MHRKNVSPRSMLVLSRCGENPNEKHSLTARQSLRFTVASSWTLPTSLTPYGHSSMIIKNDIFETFPLKTKQFRVHDLLRRWFANGLIFTQVSLNQPALSLHITTPRNLFLLSTTKPRRKREKITIVRWSCQSILQQIDNCESSGDFERAWRSAL